MRGLSFSLVPLWAILAAAAGLALWTISLDPSAREEVFRNYAASGEAFRDGRYWTLVTYGFFHGGVVHAVLNLAGLKIAGSAAIRRWGWPSALALFVAGVLLGGLAQVALRPDTYLVGLSGGVFALMVAACLGWDRERVWLGFGPLRLARLSGRSLGLGFLIGALVVAAAHLGRADSSIAHDCHAAGALVGWIWWRIFWRVPE